MQITSFEIPALNISGVPNRFRHADPFWPNFFFADPVIKKSKEVVCFCLKKSKRGSVCFL